MDANSCYSDVRKLGCSRVSPRRPPWGGKGKQQLELSLLHRSFSISLSLTLYSPCLSLLSISLSPLTVSPRRCWPLRLVRESGSTNPDRQGRAARDGTPPVAGYIRRVHLLGSAMPSLQVRVRRPPGHGFAESSRRLHSTSPSAGFGHAESAGSGSSTAMSWVRCNVFVVRPSHLGSSGKCLRR